MATHSSILAWEISWTEEPGGHSSWGHTTEHTRSSPACRVPPLGAAGHSPGYTLETPGEILF